jgi:hypothetical protein
MARRQYVTTEELEPYIGDGKRCGEWKDDKIKLDWWKNAHKG